eukprot:1157510-Pelagomonas_calceolata.AAC.25
MLTHTNIQGKRPKELRPKKEGGLESCPNTLQQAISLILGVAGDVVRVLGHIRCIRAGGHPAEKVTPQSDDALQCKRSTHAQEVTWVAAWVYCCMPTDLI